MALLGTATFIGGVPTAANFMCRVSQQTVESRLEVERLLSNLHLGPAQRGDTGQWARPCCFLGWEVVLRLVPALWGVMGTELMG